jgi:hypothetical protein
MASPRYRKGVIVLSSVPCRLRQHFLHRRGEVLDLIDEPENSGRVDPRSHQPAIGANGDDHAAHVVSQSLMVAIGFAQQLAQSERKIPHLTPALREDPLGFVVEAERTALHPRGFYPASADRR